MDWKVFGTYKQKICFVFVFEETLNLLDDDELDTLADTFMMNNKFDYALRCLNQAIVIIDKIRGLLNVHFVMKYFHMVPSFPGEKPYWTATLPATG